MLALRGRIKLAIVIFSLLLVQSAVAASANRIDRLSLQKKSNTILFNIDSAKPLKLQTLVLDKPPRYVIDIDHGQLSQMPLKVPSNQVLANIRHAYKTQHCLRLVFDLKGQAKVKLSRSRHGRGYRTTLVFAGRARRNRPHFFSAFHPQPGSKSTRDVVVVIDSGHGGKDPGATGVHGVQEKTIVLKIAQLLHDRLNATPGFKAVLTRSGDYYLTLRQRLAIARQYHPDMFIAIHADAYPDHEAHGASVFALSLRGATSEAARWLASKENESELMGGVELENKSALLRSVLLNLSQTATIRASLRIGQRIMHALASVGGLHTNKVEQAAFVVLKSPDIPSLLVETGFLSNVYEERKLMTPSYQTRLAGAIADGVQSYFAHWPPRGTTLAHHESLRAG